MQSKTRSRVSSSGNRISDIAESDDSTHRTRSAGAEGVKRDIGLGMHEGNPENRSSMAGRKEGQREGKGGGEKESRGLRNNEIKDSMVRECALYSVRTAFIYVRSFDLSDSFSTVTCLAFPRDGFKLRTRATLRSYPFRSTRSFCCTIFCRVFLSLSLPPSLCVSFSFFFMRAKG